MLTAGVEQDRNPRSIALDIVGRVGPNGRRSGGVVGLHSQFSQYVSNARTELETLSLDYFTRSRRDRRFDALVRRAIDDARPLSSKTIDRLVHRYQDRLLQTRGNNVARSEALAAMNASAEESLRQVVDEGPTPSGAIQRVWDATGDSRTRASHWDANGQRVGLNESFTVGGASLMHPGDPNAPAKETVNCRCIVRHIVDFARVV